MEQRKKIRVLKVTSENVLKKIEVTTKELSALYNNENQSKLTFNLKNGKVEFFTDSSGNYAPPKALNFDEDLRFRRISDMLPLTI